MNAKQTQQLELIRKAASAYGCNVRECFAPATFAIWLGRNNGKELFFTLNAQGKPVHCRIDSIYGLHYTKKEAVALLQEIVDLYIAEMDAKEIAEVIEENVKAESADAGVAEYQIWYKLNLADMSAEQQKRFLKADGSEPEFLAVSALHTLQDAQDVLEQERIPGYIYWIKEVAA